MPRSSWSLLGEVLAHILRQHPDLCKRRQSIRLTVTPLPGYLSGNRLGGQRRPEQVKNHSVCLSACITQPVANCPNTVPDWRLELPHQTEDQDLRGLHASADRDELKKIIARYLGESSAARKL